MAKMDELRERFMEDLKEAKRYYEPIQRQMDRDYEAYRNQRNREDGEFKTSDLFTYTETVVPIVTNNRIRANVRSDYPEYVTHAKGLNDILDHTYDTNRWDYLSQELLRRAIIYRSSFAYTGFDTDYRNIGKLCVKPINGRWVMTDPAAVELEDSRFFFCFEPMRKTQLYKMYPDKKKEIDKAVGSNDGSLFNNQQGAGGWFKTFISTMKNYLVFNGTDRAKIVKDPTNSEMSEEEKHKNVVAHIHYWYRDDKDEWRCSYWADETPLKDEANPFWHGRLPYDILSPVKDPMSMLGVPMNEQVETMNEQRNIVMNYIVENAGLHAKPPMLFNTSFGNVRDPEVLNEQARGSGVVPVNNPDMVPLNAIADYVSVPTLPGYVVNLFDQLGAIQDNVTGVNDSFRGTQQASSGKEVQLQQEAAYTRIKTMIDQFELFNQNIAEKIIVNAMQFYTTTRGFRIKGDYRKYEADQQRGVEMPFEVEPIQKGVNSETGEPINDRTEFFLYANPNEWTRLQPEEASDEEDEGSAEARDAKKAFKVLQMSVEIEAGSSLPQSRLARREEAAELFGAGAIDQEALLDAYDWPDREEIMKRMQEAKAAEQQAAMQAAQAEAQAKAQAEQAKLQQEMQIKQMELEANRANTEANNNAKLQQQQAGNGTAEQGASNTGLAEVIDQIKQQFPQIANLPDEQIIAIVTGQTGAA
jgi:hypothetical protein